MEDRSIEDALGSADRLISRLSARAARHDVEGEFPSDDFDDLKQAGLMGLMAPKRVGGLGGRFSDYVKVAFALARGNGSTALLYNMHSSIIGALALMPDNTARLLGATDEFFEGRDNVFRAAVGGAFYAVAMSERGAGARLSEMKTSYRKLDGGSRFHIEGSKTFVSGAGHADAYLVAARSQDDVSGDVSYFLVPASNGLTVEKTWDSLGMRATGSHDLHIDTTVGNECLLGGVEGLAISLAQTMPQWLVASYSAVYVGVAQAAIDAAVEHLQSRSLGHLPAARSAVGRADAAVASAWLAVKEAARCVDEAPGEEDTNRWVYRAKLLAGDTAATVASAMLEMSGTSATRRGNPLERLYRDARCGALQPATSSVCADWLGMRALGVDDIKSEIPRW